MNEDTIVTKIGEPLYRVKGWIMFAGVLSIIQGILLIPSIVGIIVCWIPIWMGVVLCSASKHIRIAFDTNNDDEFRTSLDKLGTYFRIFGILMIVMIVIAILGIFAAVMIPQFVKLNQ